MKQQDWEKKFDEIWGTLLPMYKVESKKFIVDQKQTGEMLKNFIHQQHSSLIEEIRGEVRGMKQEEIYVNMERVDDKSFTEGQEYNQALSDLDEALKKKL